MENCILMFGIPEPLLDSLSSQIRASGYQVLPAFSLSIAGWLTEQRRFALIVINVEHFQTGLHRLSAANLTIGKQKLCDMTENMQANRVQSPKGGLCAVLP